MGGGGGFNPLPPLNHSPLSSAFMSQLYESACPNPDSTFHPPEIFRPEVVFLETVSSLRGTAAACEAGDSSSPTHSQAAKVQQKQPCKT